NVCSSWSAPPFSPGITPVGASSSAAFGGRWTPDWPVAAGDAARADQQVLELHLPLEGGVPRFGRLRELLVQRLPPAQVLLLLEQDQVEDARGRPVADRVGDCTVVAVVDRQVRLQHAVEPDDAQQLVALRLQRLDELEELLV